MIEKSGSDEGLNDIRADVCSRCAGYPVRETWNGEPGTPCGCELPLAQLVEALQQHPEARAAVEACGVDTQTAEWESVRHCPCPLETVAGLAIEAAAALEQQRLADWNTLESWEESVDDDDA